MIYWPTLRQTWSYKHPHFRGDFNKVEGIGDCTEQWIQRSSNTKAQLKLTAFIKVITLSRTLLFVLEVVSVSNISDAYPGSTTDRFITEDTNIAARFTHCYTVLFNKDFNVQNLFLPYKVTARIPAFVRSKRQLTP